MFSKSTFYAENVISISEILSNVELKASVCHFFYLIWTKESIQLTGLPGKSNVIRIPH